MTEITLIAIIVFIAGVTLFLFWQRNVNKGKQDSSFLMLQNQLNEMARMLDAKLGESTRLLQTQFGQSAKIIKEITEELMRVGEGQKQVLNITDQLKNLQDILKNPKQRGVLGEYYLETLLKNVMPPGSYQMQHKLGKDETGHDLIVDAVVFVKEKIIPIDSKFSLENYNRLADAKEPAEKDRLEKLFVSDLKNRIIETSKYIQPDQGTTDFAFMFIPHEAIYYDLLINKVGAVTDDTENLVQRAAGKYRVIIVSPTSFLAYLQTVLQGLKAMQIEETAKEIQTRVEDLGRHIANYETYMQKLGTHLGTSVNTYNIAYKELGKIDKDVLKITGKSGEIDVLEIDRPQTKD
jgi:DNA recombination protein RmuC